MHGPLKVKFVRDYYYYYYYYYSMALPSNADLRLHKALLFNLSSQFFILRLLITVGTQFHHLFLVALLSTSQRIIIKYLNYFSFNIHSQLSIQRNRRIPIY
jgi:hypothetical protein